MPRIAAILSLISLWCVSGGAATDVVLAYQTRIDTMVYDAACRGAVQSKSTRRDEEIILDIQACRSLATRRIAEKIRLSGVQRRSLT